MKQIVLLLLLFISTNIYSQTKSSSKPVDINAGKSKWKTLKLITSGNEDEYYRGEFIYFKKGSYNQSDKESTRLFNNDTLTKIFNTLDLKDHNFFLIITTATNSYEINKLSAYDFDKKDTIIYNLNYAELTYQTDELKEKVYNEIKERNKKSDAEFVEKLKQIVIKDIGESISYYDKKIKGKSRNKIADFLYEENFSHDYFTGGTLGEEFSGDFTYTGYEQSDMFYRITISLWYSYGYGNLYYKINADYKVKGVWYNYE